MPRQSAMALPKRMDITKRQEADLRDKFLKKAGRIGNRLVKNALGELKQKVDGEWVATEMSNSELRAAEIVLKKAVPDLSATTHKQEDPLLGMSRDEMVSQLQMFMGNPVLGQLLKQAQGVPDEIPEDLNTTYRVEVEDAPDGS